RIHFSFRSPPFWANPGPSNRELLADRQRADALAGGGKDRIHQSRRERRQAGFAGAARWCVAGGRHDVDMGYQRCFVHPDHREVVEVLLLHPAVLEADLAIFGEAQPHDRAALDLRLDALRCDVGAAIEGGIDPRHRELTCLVDSHLDDGRDVADEAAVDGDAEAMALWHLPSPFAFLRDYLHDTPQACGIDRIAVIGLAVIPVVLDRVEL